ncbi:MAG TPA: hypothetical protein VE011_05205 [Candidatus Dormibacteraeota bacterium]|nr:hypothetical protein [Candidatus Dormibacteraeota bacterium]
MGERSKTRKPRASPSADERVRFQTETGSVYEIVRDTRGMRWRRLTATLASGPLRNDGADLLSWPEVRVGERCSLLSEPFTPPFPRTVFTSVVVAILEREPGGESAPQKAPARRSFRDVSVGDSVTRLLGGSIAMALVVTSVDDSFIYCGEDGWKFDRDSGVEVDEEIGWGPQFGITGSFLIHEEEVS